MTDSLKLTEMQRTSIEFERQRHLANWFIKSSPHMATPPPSLNPNGCTKNGTITGNPLFYLVPTGQNKQTTTGVPSNGGGIVQQINNNSSGGGGNLALSRSQIFNSQTNLPLQIVTTSSSQEGRKPKLRRFNSHDTSANMFSVADFENARLARRNEIEMKQRQQQQRLKMNSLSSGGDCSTGDSKGSKYSNDSQTEPLPADIFLERYSLPRVVRISHKTTKFSHETLQSSSSTGSSSTQSSISLNKTQNNNCDLTKQNGELFLLYRHLRQRNIYHGYNTKTGVANRKKGVMIPQEFPGYFSMISDKGTPTATMYTTLIQLVRERVYKFVSVDNLPAFTESQSTSNTPDGFVATRPHYIKSTARGGQVFRLLAVFEDGKQQQNDNSNLTKNSLTSSASNTTSGREKEKGRYAQLQLLNENRQILYVSLSAKGKFYEIEPSIPQILQKVGMINGLSGGYPGEQSQQQQHQLQQQKKLNPDCVHRINSILTSDKILPINLKFISGPSVGSGNSTTTNTTIPENLTINRISIENSIIACPIEDVEQQSPLHLRKLPVTNELIFMKCMLGFENEQRMLANPNIQNILKFCQFNCDPFIKQIEIEILNRPERSASKSRVDGLKILKPLNFPRLLRREKTTIAHEKEDSIIFLSKNDLANLEANNNKEDQQQQQTTTNQNRISDKMKVFQSTKKKWFKRNDKHTSMTSLDIDIQAKRMSMERYNDMSKLLQERFGDRLLTNDLILDAGSSNNNKQPVIGIQTSNNNNKQLNSIVVQQNRPPLLKSLSLQEVDFIEKQPDLLPSIFTATTLADSMTNLNTNSKTQNDANATDNDDDYSIKDHQQNQPLQQQSFISEKLYSEFHVKTRQYSKSSSSLHQLLHFAVPQKMNVVETTKKSTTNTGQHKDFIGGGGPSTSSKKFDFIIGEPVHHDFVNGVSGGGGSSSFMMNKFGEICDSTSTTIIDDLPYSSVRDSLLIPDNQIINSDLQQPSCSNNGKFNNYHDNNMKFNQTIINNNNNHSLFDDNRENIYAEICHHPTNNSNNSSNNSNTTISVITTTNNDICPTNDINSSTSSSAIVGISSGGCSNGIGVAISRVQINGNTNNLLNNIDDTTITAIKYPDVMIVSSGTAGNSNENHQHNNKENNCNKKQQLQQKSSTHCNGASIDNIYNTLK